MRAALLVCALATLNTLASAQDRPGRDAPSGYGAVYGDTSSTRFRQKGWAGPASPGATLAFDDQPKESFIGRFPVVHMKPWYEWKGRFNQKHGIQLGGSYQAAWISASAGITSDSPQYSAGGVLSVPIVWALSRDSGNKTVFTVQFESRHVYGRHPVSPQLLAFETGTILPTSVKFGEASFRVLLLHVGQQFLDGRAGVVIGKMAADDYFSHHQMMHPFINYQGFGSIISPAGNWMNPGFGVGAGYLASDQIYIRAAVTDVFGDPFNKDVLDFGDNFFKGNVQWLGEVGWVPSWEDRYVKRMAVTVWRSDAHDGFQEDQGLTWTSNWTINKWVPFLLAGWSKGRAANVLATSTVTAGVGYTFGTHDVIGGSWNWNRPPGGLRDQTTLEGFYRFYLSERVAISPNVQWVFNPSLNVNEDSIVYSQLRVRFDF